MNDLVDNNALGGTFAVMSWDAADRGDHRYLTKRGNWSIYPDKARVFHTESEAAAVAARTTAPDAQHLAPTASGLIID